MYIFSHLGPAHWAKMFKKCGGARQSPIDIISSEADYNDKLDEFEFSENYDDPIEGAIIENNGHTSMFDALFSSLSFSSSFFLLKQQTEF